MASIGTTQLTATDVHDVTTEKNGVLGMRAVTADGRVYRYAKNGTTALAAGATVEAPATSEFSTSTRDALQVADSTIHIASSVGSLGAAYENAVVNINDALYLANGVSGQYVSLADRIDRPVADSDPVVITANQYCGVVAGSGDVIGTAEVAVPAGAYFWAFVSL